MLEFTGLENLQERDVAACVADIPEYRPDRNPQEEYADAPEELIWDPSSDLKERPMTDYIRTAKSILIKKQVAAGIEENTAVKSASKDAFLEHMIEVLHKSKGDKSAALRHLRTEEMPTSLTEKWTTEEMIAFRKGLEEHKRDLKAIKKECSLNRSMQEITHFYYGWKRAGGETKGKVASRPNRYFKCAPQPKNHVLIPDCGKGMTTRKRNRQNDEE